MHVSRTPSASLDTKRIDPDYYAPAHLADEMKIRAFGAVELGTAGRLFAGPFGSELPTSVFVDEGVPLFRVGNVGEMAVEARDLARIPPQLHAELSASEVVPGDLLVVKASVGEKLCVIPASMPRANITQHIIGLRPNGTIDMGFAAAVLFSGYGRRQLQRRALGAIIQYLGVQEARTVLLPRIGSDAQRYVASKIRQAEVLREWGRSLIDSSFRLVMDLFPEARASSGLTRRPSRTTPAQLLDRLNAEAYAPDYLQDSEALHATGLPLRPLGDLVTAPINNSIRGVTDALGQLDGEVPMFRPADISGLWASSETAPLLPRSFEAAHAKSRVFPGDIVLSIAGTIGTAGRVPPTVEYGNINGSSARLCVREDVRGYLLVLLNTPLGMRLTTRWAVGAVQRHLNLEDLPGILFPVAPDGVLATLNKRVSKAEMAHVSQQCLVTSARLLVEALIERKVTEAELIAASKDPSADKALLGRLTSKGLDIGGVPLFSNVDALLELVDTAQGAK